MKNAEPSSKREQWEFIKHNAPVLAQIMTDAKRLGVSFRLRQKTLRLGAVRLKERT